MKVKIKKPNATEYDFTFEKDDELYSYCNWARITLDHENYCLTAVTDCGDYAHEWCATPDTESFIKLMSRINDEYLLGKISSESVVNVEQTKIDNIEMLKEYFEGEDSELEDMVEQINNIEKCCEESLFIQIDEIVDGHLESCDIDIVKDYPLKAKTFCRIFKEFLQPVLREELKNETNIN